MPNLQREFVHSEIEQKVCKDTHQKGKGVGKSGFGNEGQKGYFQKVCAPYDGSVPQKKGTKNQAKCLTGHVKQGVIYS